MRLPTCANRLVVAQYNVLSRSKTQSRGGKSLFSIIDMDFHHSDDGNDYYMLDFYYQLQVC